SLRPPKRVAAAGTEPHRSKVWLPRPSGGCATRHALHDVGIAVALRLRTLRRLRTSGHLEYTGALLALLADLHGQVDVGERAALRARELRRGVQRERRG